VGNRGFAGPGAGGAAARRGRSPCTAIMWRRRARTWTPITWIGSAVASTRY